MKARNNFLILNAVIFILLSINIGVSPINASNQSQNNWLGTDLYLQSPSSDITYSTRTFNGNNSKIELFTTYTSNNSLYYSNHTMYPGPNGSNYFGQNSYLSYDSIDILNNSISFYNHFNYFISNNTRFLVISSETHSESFFEINLIGQNQSVLYKGKSEYKLALITTLADSSDVYFCFYNSSSFIIAKYNFSNMTFSNYYSVNYYSNQSFITKVNVFSLENKLYTAVTDMDLLNQTNVFSTFTIFDSNNVTFKKEIQGISVNTFTSTSNGLLIVNNLLNNLLFYNYKDQTLTTEIYNTNNITISGSTQFKTFNNQTFLIFSYGAIQVVSINAYLNGVSLSTFYSYQTNYVSKVNAFYLQNNLYFGVAGNPNYSEYVIAIRHIWDLPQMFQLSTTTFPNQQYDYSSYSTSYNTVTYSSGSPFSSLIIIFLVIGGVILLAYYLNKRTDDKQYYPPRDPRYLNNNNRNNNIYLNNSNYIQKGPTNDVYKNSFCQNCGSVTEIGDIFCQNCGSRL